MSRLFVPVFLFLFMSNLCIAQTEQWSLDLEAVALSPTLYPSESIPDSVLLSSGKALLRVGGEGQVLWAVEHNRALQTSPTAADLNDDGKAEIAVADDKGHVFVYSADGALQWSHDFDTPTGPFKHIVAADVHPNPNLEMLIGFDDGWLNCLSADGELLWRFFGDKFHVGIMAVGDATGDGYTDIVYGTDNGNVYCLNGWGHVQWRYSEVAPYGRSGVNLADLDGDGTTEVLLTRSNQGNATCQMALDGKTGAFKWRSPTFMQGYVSNAIADLDGDGSPEVIHADKGNRVYATRADGSRMWEAELGGRGIFWAPAIADVDGDGKLDIITGVRGSDPNDQACVYRISADGRILDRLALGSGANASPAIGDIDGDGKLEVLVTVEGPTRLVALSWGGGGRVAWPGVRGDSGMRGTRVAIGAPMASGTREDVGSLVVEDKTPAYWGAHSMHTPWLDEKPPKDSAFFSVSASREPKLVEHRVFPVNVENRTTPYHAYLAGGDPTDITISLHRHDGSTLGRSTIVREPRLLKSANEGIMSIANYVRSLGEEAGADLTGLDGFQHRIERLVAEIAESERQRTPIEETTALVDSYWELYGAFNSFLGNCESFWRRGDLGVFAASQDRNPWNEDYDYARPMEDSDGPVLVTAYGDEFEDLAINLTNMTSESIDVRCSFTPPALGSRPDRVPAITKRITLRRCVPIPKRGGGYVLDALPELDRSGVITLPAYETRQVWLVFDTHGLDDGEYDFDFYAASMTHPPTVRKIPIKLKVWQVRLPEGVYSQMNWGYIDPSSTSDQDLQSMLDHGVSVANAPALPRLPVDADGKANGDPNWTVFDETLARVPDYFQLMFHGEMRPQWPEGTTDAEKEAASDAAFASGVQAMSAHLQSIGWGYDRWAFYHLDEPWLTGLTVIPELREFCEKVRTADPRVRLYANPTGKLKIEYLEEFKDLIDVWQPEMNFLKRDPELLAWFQKNAKTLWAYEATDPGKELLPLGYYRSLGWLAWDLGLSGGGFWVYKYHDLWWPLDVTNWAVVYPSGDEVVPSRRWEACRDGQEDYRALYLLREEIQKARDGRRMEDAERAEKLLEDAVEKVAGWQVGVIDEITRQTRDYEIDYQLLLDYRARIADMIIDLRASGAHSPIHFLGD
jgi:hypothetical protein